jgi:hypothetical protein
MKNTITQLHKDNFKPTYLYIKQHTETGKLYFGKTTQKNVERYTGSGIHWGRHITAHGKDKVVTLWYCLFTDIETLVETAVAMSDIMDITGSSDWLNFKPESGLDGGSFKGFNGWAGKRHSPEHIEKLKKLGAERPATEKMRSNMSRVGKMPRTEKQSEASKLKAKSMGDANKGRTASKETRDAMSKAKAGKGHGIIYTIQTPSGITTTDCLKLWCVENNINYSSLRNTIANKAPHKKTGFMILSSTEE